MPAKGEKPMVGGFSSQQAKDDRAITQNVCGQAGRLVSVAFPGHPSRSMPVLKAAAFVTAKVIPLLSMTIADAPEVTAFVHEWPQTLRAQ